MAGVASVASVASVPALLTSYILRRKSPTISVRLDFHKCVHIFLLLIRKSAQCVYIYCTDSRRWRGNLDNLDKFSVQIRVSEERKISTHFWKSRGTEFVGSFQLCKYEMSDFAARYRITERCGYILDHFRCLWFWKFWSVINFLKVLSKAFWMSKCNKLKITSKHGFYVCEESLLVSKSVRK